MGHGGYRPNSGRRKGSKASHTLQAEKGKALLIQMYLENVRPINQALIDKALAGDIQAIRELHERVYGKVTQPIGGDKDNPIIIQGVEISFRE
jgi:hypothetical protein